jgi:hypothetical protein
MTIDNPLDEESKRIYIELAQELVDILERFQCANIHERNRHRANCQAFIYRLESGLITTSVSAEAYYTTWVALARDWLLKTLREQLTHAKEATP